MKRILFGILVGAVAWNSPLIAGSPSSRATQSVYKQLLESTRAERLAELADKEIVLGDKRLKWKEKTFGDAPEGGRSWRSCEPMTRMGMSTCLASIKASATG